MVCVAVSTFGLSGPPALTWSGDMPEKRVSDVRFSSSDGEKREVVFAFSVANCCTMPSCFSPPEQYSAQAD